jgi:uncharacterized membrane protein YjjP (DUF1212 family)
MTHRLETALDAALIVMKSGGSTAATARSFANILNGCEIEDVAAVWRLDFIAATGKTRNGRMAALRQVGPIGINLVRAAEVVALSERVARGQVPVEVLDAELNRLRSLPSPYSRWALALVTAVAAAAYSQLAGGDWGSLGIAFVAAGTGQALRLHLGPKGIGGTLGTFVSSVVSAAIAALGLRLGLSGVPAATLVASVIHMFPGMPLINGFMDVISTRYQLTGLERIANAVCLFVVVAIAVALAYALFG